MSAYTVACPHCGEQHGVRPEHLGRRARCTCGQSFVVEFSETAAPEKNVELTSCRYCGFEDSGNFCSNCGGRLNDDSFSTLGACKVSPESLKWLKQKLADATEDNIDEYEQATFAVDDLSRQIRDVADALRRNEQYGWDHLLGRSEVEHVFERLPAGFPGLEKLRSNVFTLVTDLERKAAEQESERESERDSGMLSYRVESFKGAVAAGSVARARKWLGEYRQMVENEGKKPTVSVSVLEAELAELESRSGSEKLLAAYAKLEEKASKLSFTGEHKKAMKAWQECLFWLSRNNHPEGDKAKSVANAGIQKAQESLAGK